CEVGSTTATSHSSLAHTSARHQSPDARHGPEAQTILPLTLRDESARALMRVGRPLMVCTSACHGGRKTLKPITHCELRIADCGLDRGFFRVAGKMKRLIRNASGRCVSKSSGEPRFSGPTNFASRAKVISSFSG